MDKPTPSSAVAQAATITAQTKATRVASGQTEATRRLLEAPVLATLLRLSGPTMAAMVLQVAVSILEAYYVSGLGADALAGVTLVFPWVVLMFTMAAGSMGGAVASAVARALGNGRQDDANALVLHALLVAAAMSVLFSSVFVLGGRGIFAAMGGDGVVLDYAVQYANVIFGGAIAYWLFNTSASLLRGTGNMQVPAVLGVVNLAVYAPLAPALVLGWGPLPALGLVGVPAASVAVFGFSSLVLLLHVISGRSVSRPNIRRTRLQPRLIKEILRVGIPASLNPLLSNATLALVTALVGQFGAHALAGFGLAARLEFVLAPLIFGFGAALVTLVGMNIGAGQVERAHRIAWLGAALAAGLAGSVGVAAAAFPDAWLGLFSADADVRAAGQRYLTIVGPAFAFLGLGLALYFASQGAGRMKWPLFAGCLRLVVAVGGGWIASQWFGLTGLFAMAAAALVTFGSTIAIAIQNGGWRREASVA